mmetsp:Transcript_21879/g.50796  ORF Transcript_21879/g.50796 Transcript_21879/m.50796 type:complete len:276 (-) Transcript_21879:487-1314(-)
MGDEVCEDVQCEHDGQHNVEILQVPRRLAARLGKVFNEVNVDGKRSEDAERYDDLHGEAHVHRLHLHPEHLPPLVCLQRQQLPMPLVQRGLDRRYPLIPLEHARSAQEKAPPRVVAVNLGLHVELVHGLQVGLVVGRVRHLGEEGFLPNRCRCLTIHILGLLSIQSGKNRRHCRHRSGPSGHGCGLGRRAGRQALPLGTDVLRRNARVIVRLLRPPRCRPPCAAEPVLLRPAGEPPAAPPHERVLGVSYLVNLLQRDKVENLILTHARERQDLCG